MIQENKFIFKFIYGVLIDELCESAQLITNQDLSRLAKSLENTHVKNINISPSLVDIPQSDDDIFIVLDDVNLSPTDIGKIKNLLSQKILICTKSEKSIETQEMMTKLGFQLEFNNTLEEKMCFSYNLKTYNNKRSWNNSEGWANPENFDKFRW
ncbi:DUF6231 family protein [Gammaproteobacteria bacterium]|nr:DUF6231 family protein [Gammaproteobacteria bacterium]MDA9046164.1 DUF6231 family protein [Gammaproteobacteria bacterium]MDC0990888.1 DUF6231 family protein [Gammaproteobacteria bacterium]